MLQIVENAAPKETSTDRIERAIAELATQDGAEDDPELFEINFRL